MTAAPPESVIENLESQQNIWFSSVRPSGRPHLAPVWFVWHEDRLYISTDPNSVKRRNVDENPHVVLALEDGTHPVICEGTARHVPAPLPEPLHAAFLRKYEWDVHTDAQYNYVIEVTPVKWLAW